MRRLATNKSGDAEIRELYGWTQSALAAYLNVGRSLLSLCEIGERALPSEAAMKWLEWIKFTHIDAALEKGKAALTLPLPDTKNLLRRAADCEWEAQGTQRKLEAMQKRHEQALNNMALCQHLLSTTPNTKAAAFDRQQLNLTLSIATATQKSEGEEAQALLQCKIDGLLHEAENCRQRAAALAGSGK